MCFTLNFLFFDAILMTMRACYLSLLLSPIRKRYYVEIDEYAFWIERSGGDFLSFFQTKCKQKRRGKTFLSANIYERNLTRDSFSLSIAYGDNVYM